MPRIVKQGYSASALGAFVESQIEYRETKGNNMARYINGVRMSADDGRRLLRWMDDTGDVDLSGVDRFLIRYDLALWEFEHWATERYGHSTFFDRDEVTVA